MFYVMNIIYLSYVKIAQTNSQYSKHCWPDVCLRLTVLQDRITHGKERYMR